MVVVDGCGGCGWMWMWMWRFLSAVIFFFSFFVSGGCGMGGGFLVGGWVLSFVVIVGSVVASGVENSWVVKERNRGEREIGRKRKNKK